MARASIIKPTEYCSGNVVSLHSVLGNDILIDADIANLINNAMRKNIEKRIDQVHVTKNGTPRKILSPSENRRGFWSTCTPDRKEIFASTKDELYRKLYDYYNGRSIGLINPNSFGEVWKKAHEHYNLRHPDKEKTIQCHAYDFRRFINAELRNKDIETIDTDYLELYAINMCKSMTPTVKAYKSFKGVLYLTFRYALRHSKEYGVTFNPAEYVDDSVVYPYLNQSLSSRDAEDVMHSPEEITAIFAEAEKRSKQNQFHGYYIYEFMMKIHDEIGCRPGELVALKWKDVTTDIEGNPIIHIHAQQIDMRKNGEIKYVQYTKNERGISKGGRYFPITDNMNNLLDRLKKVQAEKGIVSEFIFCDINGKWINVKQYSRTLKSICDTIGIKSKGSYAFRRDVNCAMYESGMTDILRGRAIGNGPLTNLVHYVHPKSEYTEQARQALTARNQKRSELVRTIG